ncbi:TPA: metallopeptidase [archaeon]|jgi:predicted metallopeptidase|uniref:Metallopeptidase n=1 Tax=Candidatus Undinarchaeum marinum TaxID=2756141 RepID=A0A832XFQ4_9ARCH|nr:metallopeptidase [Candidatus Undinarchaeum marinum]
MVIKYEPAPDVKMRLVELITENGFSNVDPSKIYCFRSRGSKSKRILARIWSFPKIWQMALFMPPRYVIEVLSERYDKLSKEKQDYVLIHELKHIPKKFSGGLRTHHRENPKHLRK